MNSQFYDIAHQELGVQEEPGAENCARILLYHTATKLKATGDDVPWCSAFACWVVEQTGIASPRSAWARDWLRWGKELKNPERGCICVFTRGSDSGHVGFYDSEDKVNIYVLGGNQDDKVRIKPYLKSRLLGFRSAR